MYLHTEAPHHGPFLEKPVLWDVTVEERYLLTISYCKSLPQTLIVMHVIYYHVSKHCLGRKTYDWLWKLVCDLNQSFL